jgi:hypothetical protein
VRHPGHLSPGPIESVATLDADRLHFDEDLVAGHDRLGHVLVAQYLGSTGFVIDGCLHPAPSIGTHSFGGRPSVPALARSRFIYAQTAFVHAPFTSLSRILLCMGDFMAVLGIIAFALVMLGLIWGLDHV